MASVHRDDVMQRTIRFGFRADAKTIIVHYQNTRIHTSAVTANNKTNPNAKSETGAREVLLDELNLTSARVLSVCVRAYDDDRAKVTFRRLVQEPIRFVCFQSGETTKAILIILHFNFRPIP